MKYNGSYWYVTGGYMKATTTLVKYGDYYWYIKNGKVSSETTLVKYGGKYWYVKNGKMNRATTLVRYGNYYWYVSNGTTQATTTLVKYNGKYYFVYRGKVNFNYTGVITYKGRKWQVVKGVVTKKYYTWPTPGNYRISEYYGPRVVPTPGASSNHQGLDIACDYGDPVVACASGIVISAAYNSHNGNYVFINHGGGVVSLYLHNSVVKVKAGQRVREGQLIALAGSTGVSTGPHLHFGIKVNDEFVNPLLFITNQTFNDSNQSK